jgi:hypothetical protein
MYFSVLSKANSVRRGKRTLLDTFSGMSRVEGYCMYWMAVSELRHVPGCLKSVSEY